MAGEAIIKPLRSALFMPASNARALEKSRGLEADAYIFDLEDSVAPDAKAMARFQACDAIRYNYGRAIKVIRINGVDSPWFKDDVAVVAATRADAVLLPKTNGAGDVAHLVRALASHGADEHTKIWCMIETPLAVMRVDAIAEAHASVTCLVMGTADLAKDLRCHSGLDRTPLLYSLERVILSARAVGLDVLDGVYPSLDDQAGFEQLCHHGRMLGFDGKTLVHPSQITAANHIFSPSLMEIAQANQIIGAYKAALTDSKAIAVHNGQMIELLHVKAAERLLALGKACGLNSSQH